MATGRADRKFELSRREFLVTTGGALAGMAAFGLVEPAAASKRHPQRGGTLQLWLERRCGRSRRAYA